ncbi:NADP-specific glutamate dehydrogenase [soil metagenome]
MEESPLLQELIARTAGEDVFRQAAEEVFDSVKVVLERNQTYRRLKLFERMLEPERLVSFRVTWLDDAGEVQVNRGYRVQMNSALGPYKGGLRFSPFVTQAELKFLAFEQTFKNALTRLPLGGGKGGADFNPKGKSETEVMRFCQNFMLELKRHIGPYTDVPAGDIGVGGREIGYLFGMYKKLHNEFTGVITGKDPIWGGSKIRTEATGYGLVFFAEFMLQEQNDTLAGKRCLVSGAGNVAQYTLEQLLKQGAIPVTVSDSSGYIYDEAGIDKKKLAFILRLKNGERGGISAYAEEYPESVFTPADAEAGYNPLWQHPADCAFPCATQNEINARDAQHLADNGVRLLAEGANMPLTHEALAVIQQSGIRYAPGKAANAGGVAVSGLEMTQNRQGVYWSRVKAEDRLRGIMRQIHDTSLHTAKEYGQPGNYAAGANIAGFLRVAEAMVAQGVV